MGAFAGLLFDQPEITAFETAADHFSLYFGYSNGVAESIVGMGVSMRVYLCTIHKVSLAVNAYGQAATFALQVKFALTAGGFYQLDFFC